MFHYLNFMNSYNLEPVELSGEKFNNFGAVVSVDIVPDKNHFSIKL